MRILCQDYAAPASPAQASQTAALKIPLRISAQAECIIAITIVNTHVVKDERVSSEGKIAGIA